MKITIIKKVHFILLLLCFTGKAIGQIINIPIETKDNVLLFQTDKDNRLWTIYFGNLKAIF